MTKFIAVNHTTGESAIEFSKIAMIKILGTWLETTELEDITIIKGSDVQIVSEVKTTRFVSDLRS